MSIGEIRTVYAVLADGTQIVRYSGSKRWFWEHPDRTRIRRFRRVSDAADLAWYQSATVFLGQPEGSYFDKYYQARQNGAPLPPVQRYTAAGRAQAIGRAQRAYDKQLRNYRARTTPYRKWGYDEATIWRYWGIRPPVTPSILVRAERLSRRRHRKAA